MEATTTHRLNVPILSAKLAKMAWWNTFWSKIAGFQTITNTNGINQTQMAPNSVVQVVRDFVQEGRDNLIMAMLMPLVENPMYGDTWLKGTGEPLGLEYLTIYINQVRKAVTALSGKMSNQRVKIYNMVEKAQPALIEWWAKWLNAAMFETLYEGSSPQLTAGTNDEGLGLKVRWHPNMYYHTAADGTISPVGTAKSFKTIAQISTAMQIGMKSASYKMINEINALIKTELLIEPIVHDDGEFWLLLVHPTVMKQLKVDDVILKYVQHSAYMGSMKKHPALKGRDFMYYDGIAILEEQTGVRTAVKQAYATAALFSAELAGTNGWMKPPLTTGTRHFGNILLGKNAIGLGIAENLNYTTEVDDHGNVKELGSNCIQGANRVEYVTDDVADAVFNKNNAAKSYYDVATPAINQSSAIIWSGVA